MRGCVAYNDLWPSPLSSRSFGLGLENRVRSVASTVLDGFFPYLVQMITSMRRCVACDDLWPWPISSRSFDLDFENRVRSVTFSVLDRLFPYLPQIITTIRGCVAMLSLLQKSKVSIFSLIFRIFFGYLFSFTNTTTIFCGTETTNPYRIRSFWPQIPFLPRSFVVQFSVASSTPPSIFRLIETPAGRGYPRRWHRLIYLV